MVDVAVIAPDEIAGLAQVLRSAYVRMVDHYTTEWQKPIVEAAQLARAPITDAMALEAGDYQHVSFARLGWVLESNPDEAMRIWSEIKRLAYDEFTSGNRSAATLGTDADPWARAQYLVIRRGFVEDWKPAGAVELSLIDMLATAFYSWQQWIERGTMWANFDTPRKYNGRKELPQDAPRQSVAEALEQAVMMADRYNRLYLRTLRALRDLRRYTVVINNPQQVNIGDQQVNVVQE